MAAKPITKAILLVGGKGTRLAPLTDKTPKPMIKIAGAPVTEHQILKARAAGITQIVLATSYLADVFRPHFGDGSRFGIQIIYSFEDSPLGTGGAIATAASELDLQAGESIFVFNGDVLSAHDLIAQRKMHQEREADATLHLARVTDARAYGCVPLDQNNQVIDFLEKMENPIANTINAGCYIFNSEVVQAIPSGLVTSVERQTFPGLLKSGARVFGYEDSSFWIDMGTPASMIQASKDLILNPNLSAATQGVSDGALIEPGCSISASAVITTGSYVETGVSVEREARISGSIIGVGAQIGANSQILDSYIAPGSRVADGSELTGEIFGF